MTRVPYKYAFAFQLICLVAIIIFADSVYARECEKKLARLFGQVICQADIGENKNTDALHRAIWNKALSQKFGPEATRPSKAEILLYSSAFKQSIEQGYKQDTKLLALIKKLLSENRYAPSDLKKLEDLREAMELSVRHYETRKAHIKDMPPEFAELAGEAEQQVAEAMVGQWKINKVLYDEYGGRIIFQQAGLEPIDAYAVFLRYIEEEGALEILDPDYTGVMQTMEDYIGMGHSVIPEGEKDIYGHYFERPDWQFKYRDGKSDYDETRQKLESIPVIGEPYESGE